MKRSHKILTAAFVAGAVLLGGSLFNASLASQDDEKMAAKAATEYASGITSGNRDKVLDNVKDTRIQDETAQKAKYDKYVKRELGRHTKMKFVRLETTPDHSFNAIFEMSSDEFKATPVTVPMIKEDGQWKVFIDGSIVVDTHNQQ